MLRQFKKIAGVIDVRDVLAFAGLALTGFGLETIFHGLGYAVTGLIVVAVAVFFK